MLCEKKKMTLRGYENIMNLYVVFTQFFFFFFFLQEMIDCYFIDHPKRIQKFQLDTILQSQGNPRAINSKCFV